ncbi:MULTISPECIES: hypothetical protein [unclassified Frankia]|uniref:hypothetical protein n=1 Tax=unclassified Frankia TaxID=2632575 RepID=UPI000AA1354D|nr:MULTISPECIES: hypothetical protein [unclassified Frankia]
MTVQAALPSHPSRPHGLVAFCCEASSGSCGEGVGQGVQEKDSSSHSGPEGPANSIPLADDLNSRIYEDLKRLINPGLVRAHGDGELTTLPHLASVRRKRSGTSKRGELHAIRTVVLGAIEQLGLPTSAAAKELLALESNPTRVEFRRDRAARAIGLQSGQGFKSHRQSALLKELADTIEHLEESIHESLKTQTPIVLEWPVIQMAIVRMHANVDRSFAPELLLTMSGPGSFAACYFSTLSSRDVPLIVCTTFPRRDDRLPSHSIFERAATASNYVRIDTSKWVVYLPNLLFELPTKTRVLILDDRILSGETQNTVAEKIGGRFDVRRAAIIAHTSALSMLDYHGMVLDDDYIMPWGSKHGRQ